MESQIGVLARAAVRQVDLVRSQLSNPGVDRSVGLDRVLPMVADPRIVIARQATMSFSGRTEFLLG